MAVCFCRWRNLFLFLCTPCILFALLFLYVGVTVCMNMQGSQGTSSLSNTVHFVAQGTYRTEGGPPLPQTFWDLHRSSGVWNLLQLSTDCSLNPILCPKLHKRLGYGVNNVSAGPRLAVGSFRPGSLVHQMDNLPSHMQRYARQMHKRDYRVLWEPRDDCDPGAKEEDGQPLVLLAIKTTEKNFRNREVIRRTWGQEGRMGGQRRAAKGFVRRVFLLGVDPSPVRRVKRLRRLHYEGHKYGDILQWDFHDSFFNLTLKDVLFWEWFSRRCSPAHFVFKGDDDIFLNTPALVDYLQQRLEDPAAARDMQSFMAGDVIGAAEPDRHQRSKYFVPESFYIGRYPPYAGGGGVVYSGLLAKRLHNMSKGVLLYPIDDVYVGMCLRRLNASPSHHPAFLTFDFRKYVQRDMCAYHRIIMVHKRLPDKVAVLWTQLKQRQPQCWNVTLRY